MELTQKQLANEICNQSEISRIEAGELLPSSDILSLLANRLRIPITYFFEILMYEEIEELKKIKDKVDALSLNKNYKELQFYLKDLLENPTLFHPETKKFLLWHKFITDYYLKKIDANYCLAELFSLLRMKTNGINILLDFQIKNSIANILAETKRYDKSIKIYQEILNEDFKTKEGDKLKNKILYNLGKLCFINKDYNSALFYTNQGIDLSISFADMTLIGQFYYQKGVILEELSFSIEEIAATFKKSEFFLEIMNFEIYLKILRENKSHFLLGRK